MGTSWHVSYLDPESRFSPETIQAGIEGRLEEINQSMSTYQPDTEISQFNRRPSGTWLPVSDDFYQVLATALDIGERSEGAYDVTVAPLVDLWGFGPSKSTDSAPAVAAIEEALASVGQEHLRLNNEAREAMKTQAVALDFSSLAKGFAVDEVARWLSANGIQAYLVEIGGEMKASGDSARGDPWRVAIEEPRPDGRAVAAAMHLGSGSAVATSGDYRNFFEIDGKRFSHSIDPRTGYPVVHDLVSVTVVHSSAMVADAWATALTVLGPERAMAVAQREGLAVYFIRHEGEQFEHSYTATFAPYLVTPQ